MRTRGDQQTRVGEKVGRSEGWVPKRVVNLIANRTIVNSDKNLDKNRPPRGNQGAGRVVSKEQYTRVSI